MEEAAYLKIEESQDDDPAAESLFRFTRSRFFGGCTIFCVLLLSRSAIPTDFTIGSTRLSGKQSIGNSWYGFGKCEKDTKGTCSMFGCSSARGPTDCVHGKCLCKDGYCSTVHGVCKPAGTCEADTGSVCNFFDCKSYLGPTTCERVGAVNHHCLCKPGWCAVSGGCVENATTLKAKVVKLDASTHKFPGPHAHVRTAVSCAGGGSRAASFCMGLLRALEFHGLMKHIDALGGASGGAWGTAPYMFSNHSLTKLLGPLTTPEILTMEELEKEPGLTGLTANVNIVHAVAKEAARQTVGPHTAWYATIADHVLGPSGLSDKYVHLAASPEHVDDIKRRNPSLQDASFIVPTPGRPKVYVLSATIIRPRDDPLNESAVLGLQISPDYSGSPYHIGNDAQLKYGNDLVTVGGGLIETFAFGGAPPENQDEGGLRDVPAPARPLSLAFAAATSSNFYAGNFAGRESVQSAYWGIGPKSPMTIFQMGDGGLLDNNVMHPMLQRGAKKFIWSIPTQLKFMTEPDYCGGAHALGTLFNNSWISDDIADKFGYGICGGGFYRCHNQVFAKDDYIPLLCEMKKAYANKEPLVLRKTLKLVANGYWMIEGGSDIDVLIIYNTLAQPFLDSLPQETQDEIRKGADGAFPNFPTYDIFAEDGPLSGGSLSYSQINLLAAHTEYMIASRLSLFEEFLQ